MSGNNQQALTQSKPRQLYLPTVGGLLAIVLWSATFALARSLAEQVGPVTAGAAVYLSGGLLLWLLRLRSLKSQIHNLKKLSPQFLFGCGFLFVIYTVLVYLAVGLAHSRDQLLEIALLNYLWPALTILFSMALLNHRANALLLPGTALALLGVFLVLTQGARVSWTSFVAHVETNPLPSILAVIAAVSWALYSNLTRRWSDPAATGAVDLFIPATGLVLLCIRFFVHETPLWTPRAVLETLLLGAVTALGYFFWETAMRKGNMLLVSSCSYFTPLLSTLVSCVYLNIAPSSQLWLGCVLLMIGSVVTRISVSDTAA